MMISFGVRTDFGLGGCTEPEDMESLMQLVCHQGFLGN